MKTQSQMQNEACRMKAWQTRSVLECGSPLPLFDGRKLFARFKSAGGPAHSKTYRQLVAVLLLGALSVISASAQSYSIDWYKVSGGGGTSSNGQYAVTGTIGQHDAGGPMTGGTYSLTGGFWALISVVQTSGAPTLYISRSGGTVTVFWQDVSGWTLQQNNNLANSAGWSANSSWTTSSGTNYLNLTTPTGNLFFRLTQ
jgi:hypothetical protein